jgi:hypothetical protein
MVSFDCIVDLSIFKDNPMGASANEQIQKLDELEILVDEALKKLEAINPKVESSLLKREI